VTHTLFIHAVNIHQGGGKSLLTSLLSASSSHAKTVVLLDRRMTLPGNIPQNITIKFVKPSILHRFGAEWWLKWNVESGDIVLAFGNLPTLFKLHGKVVLFLQNRYLVDSRLALLNLHPKAMLRNSMERLWLYWRSVNVDEFVVQTPSMKSALLSSGSVFRQPVHVRPFSDVSFGYQRTVNIRPTGHKRYDFIYVAFGEPHKNHRCLIEAWCLLAEQGLFPSLCITVDKKLSSELCRWVERKKKNLGLKLENVGFIPHVEVLPLYKQAQAMIFPSLFESFGLPLIEASQAGLPILASELDFVRDVIDPIQTFDPKSAVSIARAVKRFIEIEEPPLKLQVAEEFLKAILELDV
jgi:glycosyltransferase involved in cell wall biosynthesis